MNVKLKVWRQKDAKSKGGLVDYEASNIPEHASFLEMLDILNESLMTKGEAPIAFDHDCREGICGTCSLTINGIPHGPSATTTCQLYMRSFKDGDTIYVEPFRARPFPVVRDLITDRSAFDRLQQAGGFISARTGSAPDGNDIPVPKPAADRAMEAAACIGCGACVAACPNASAMLFTGAKIVHLGELPQGQPERRERVLRMVRRMDEEGFGNCSNYYECEAVCPAEIPITVITALNREFVGAAVREAVA
jgi:succinate dehydrogenase / fumarate reductase iron-sulfur subunit